mgnify:CR=1 FL=1
MIPEKGEGEYPLPFFVKVCKKNIKHHNIMFIRAFLSLYLVFLL